MRKLVLFLAASSVLSAQDPAEILKKVAATYKAIASYDLQLIEHSDSVGPNSKNQYETRQRIAGANGRFRQESVPNGYLNIFDGQMMWGYNKQTNEYTKRTMPAPPPNRPAVRQMKVAQLTQYEMIDQNVKSARVTGQETVQVDGSPVSCYVVEVEREYRTPPGSTQPPPQVTETHSIDFARGLVLKSVRKSVSKMPDETVHENVSTTTVTKMSINQPLPDTLFQFTPPEGAVQVDQFSPTYAKSPLIGKQLADFELKTADGKIVTPQTLHGNVAVLQFGYGCCGSGMGEDLLPFLELLHRTYKGQGVSVLYVTRSLTPEWQSEGFTMPVAVDFKGAAAAQIGLNPYGTIVIDRNGKVAYAFNGTTSAMIRIITKELQKAGVW